MGVSHKLKPETIQFLLERKKKTPQLSCRQLVIQAQQELKIKVSKSSINTLFKEAGLSAPIGRRLKKKRRYIQMPALPQLELKPLLSPESAAVIPEETKPTIEIPAAEREKLPAPQELKPKEEAAPAPEIKPLEEKTVFLPQIPSEQQAPQPKEEIPVMAESKFALPKEETSTEILPGNGTILLKAADLLIAGANCISEAVKSRLLQKHPSSLALIEKALYQTAGEGTAEGAEELSQAQIQPAFLWGEINKLFRQARCFKVNICEAGALYLDAQLFTLWSNPNVPYDFCLPQNQARANLLRCLQKEYYLTLCMAPGYSTPTQEFFNFVMGFEGREKIISGISLLGNKFEELEQCPYNRAKSHYLIFGLWPWQFTGYRRVKKIGEFRQWDFTPLNKTFYLADIELELASPAGNRAFTFRGSALKTNPSEKVRMAVLTNLPQGNFTPEELAAIYLERWPNLEEAFQDMSRKIELFTYTGSSEHPFGAELENIREGKDALELLAAYRQALDLYLRWYFLPAGYKKESYPVSGERFYGLKVEIKIHPGYIEAVFLAPAGYAYLADLLYACRRMNEKGITAGVGKKIWFSAAAGK